MYKLVIKDSTFNAALYEDSTQPLVWGSQPGVHVPPGVYLRLATEEKKIYILFISKY